MKQKKNKNNCFDCEGKGIITLDDNKTCPFCKGTKQIDYGIGRAPEIGICNACMGKGNFETSEIVCPFCEGKGTNAMAKFAMHYYQKKNK